MSLTSSRFPAELAGYPLPSLLSNEDDYQRLHHGDIPLMSDEDIRVEQLRVQSAYACAYGQKIYIVTNGNELYVLAEEWLRRRLDILDAEVRSRRGRRSA